jgi:hypothetical protein
MNFPEISRDGYRSRVIAIARLACARGEHCRFADVAAREAWLGWVERGV